MYTTCFVNCVYKAYGLLERKETVELSVSEFSIKYIFFTPKPEIKLKTNEIILAYPEREQQIQKVGWSGQETMFRIRRKQGQSSENKQ